MTRATRRRAVRPTRRRPGRIPDRRCPGVPATGVPRVDGDRPPLRQRMLPASPAARRSWTVPDSPAADPRQGSKADERRHGRHRRLASRRQQPARAHRYPSRRPGARTPKPRATTTPCTSFRARGGCRPRRWRWRGRPSWPPCSGSSSRPVPLRRGHPTGPDRAGRRSGGARWALLGDLPDGRLHRSDRRPVLPRPLRLPRRRDRHARCTP